MFVFFLVIPIYLSLPADSITTSSMLAVLGTDDLDRILLTREVKKIELRKLHPDDSDYRTAVIEYYLQTSPYASWEHLGDRYLRVMQSIFQAVNDRVKPDEGDYIIVFT